MKKEQNGSFFGIPIAVLGTHVRKCCRCANQLFEKENIEQDTNEDRICYCGEIIP